VLGLVRSSDVDTGASNIHNTVNAAAMPNQKDTSSYLKTNNGNISTKVS